MTDEEFQPFLIDPELKGAFEAGWRPGPKPSKNKMTLEEAEAMSDGEFMGASGQSMTLTQVKEFRLWSTSLFSKPEAQRYLQRSLELLSMMPHDWRSGLNRAIANRVMTEYWRLSDEFYGSAEVPK